ncbi:MAG: methyltransferase domain-containing protein [Candidatus Omnitrophica bacterium]|nr:methyltransferase domain-containing protein [Candidatus Omnitrophota bacterium]
MFKRRKTSRIVKKCQVCANKRLDKILFIGYLPPVNQMRNIGEEPNEERGYPAEMLYCPKCNLMQLGLIVDKNVLFPSEYPYTSSTTGVLRKNFAQLYDEVSKLYGLKPDDLIVDIGSNDGNLLSNFKDKCRVLGITPEDIGRIAIKRGIPTILDYFSGKIAKKVVSKYGKARIVTATNVFAHIEDVNSVLRSIIGMLSSDGIFISESHYLLPLINTLQYDTIYHEHLRYYSLHSLRNLFKRHSLEIIHAREIPTHGGSIRVYAARKGIYPVEPSVSQLLKKEGPIVLKKKMLLKFNDRVVQSKLDLLSLLSGIRKKGKRICGIGAPSRASTLINYCGLNKDLIESVFEIKGSYKIGKYMPGTLIPIVEEGDGLKDSPDYLFLFSWHIADELILNLKKKGFKGGFIIPLPHPRIV